MRPAPERRLETCLATDDIMVPIDCDEWDAVATVRRDDLRAVLDEVARLRKALRGVTSHHGSICVCVGCAALNPKRRKHTCRTRSGDEQVTCDDPKCPRKE